MALVDVTNRWMDVNRGWMCYECTMTLPSSGEGSVATPITASDFGMQTIEELSVFWDATNAVAYPAVIAPTRDSFYLLTVNSTTHALEATAISSAVLQGTVKGRLI